MIIWALLSLGDMAFNNADLPQAQAYFQETLALCSDEGDVGGGAWARFNLGRVAHALGDDRQAQTYYAEILAAFRELGARHTIAHVYLDLGRVARTQSDAAQAHVYYAESLSVIGELRDKLRLPECLEGIAGLASAAGPHPAGARRAARLFGAAESVRESAGIPLPPIQRAVYDRDLAAARAELDDAAWRRAWAEGSAMTMEHAIAEAQQALREAEAPAADRQPDRRQQHPRRSARVTNSAR